MRACNERFIGAELTFTAKEIHSLIRVFAELISI
jgi:hypothetical protein